MIKNAAIIQLGLGWEEDLMKKISNVTVLNCMGTKCKSPVNAAAKSDWVREKRIKVPEPASSTLMREDEDPALHKCVTSFSPRL